MVESGQMIGRSPSQYLRCSLFLRMKLRIDEGKTKAGASKTSSRKKFPVRLSKVVTTSVKNLMVRRRSKRGVNPLLLLSFVLLASVVLRSEWLRKVELKGFARQVLHGGRKNLHSRMEVRQQVERSLDGERWKREKLQAIPRGKNLEVTNRVVIESRANDKFTVIRKGVNGKKPLEVGVGDVYHADLVSKEAMREVRGQLKQRWEGMQGRRRKYRRAMRHRIESKGGVDDGSKNTSEISWRTQVENETDMEKIKRSNKSSSNSDSFNIQAALEKRKSSKRRHASERLVPIGARTHGRLEFHGSLGGTEDGMVRGQNVTRISYTLFKIMKLFGFTSLTDYPCGAHHEWMSEVVSWLAYEHPAFEYVGSDDDAKGVSLAKRVIGRFVDGEFRHGHALDSNSDVVFYWTELDGSERDARDKRYGAHMREVMSRAKKGGNAYIVFGQYPRLNGPQVEYRNGKWRLSGEREEPFLYNDYVRGVIAVEGTGVGYVMYMTFYCLRSIPQHVLDV